MTGQPHLLDRQAALPWAGQRVLITGASGFLGRQLAWQALVAGAEVHSLGRHAGPEGCEHHFADLAAEADLISTLRMVGPAAMIHCAAPGVLFGSAGYAEMLALAEAGTERLYAACAALPVPPQIIHVGSGFEYAPSDLPVREDWPLSPAPESYGAAKVAASAVARRWSVRLPIALLRPFHIYGAGEAARRLGPFLIREVIAGRSASLTGCEQRRDFLHVDDCAAMIWDGLNRLPTMPGLTECNLGSGHPIALADFVGQLVSELESRGYAPDLRMGELPYREGEPMVSLPDLGCWLAAGGRAARISLRDGVADLIEWELARCA